MLLVTKLRATVTELIGTGLAKLPAPTSNRLIGNKDASIEYHLLHVAVAQRKGKIQPHALLNNLAGETVAMVSLLICQGFHITDTNLRTNK